MSKNKDTRISKNSGKQNLANGGLGNGKNETAKQASELKVKKEAEANKPQLNNEDVVDVDTIEDAKDSEKSEVVALTIFERIGCKLAKRYVEMLQQQIEDIKAENSEKTTQLNSELEDKKQKLADFKKETEQLKGSIAQLNKELFDKNDSFKAKTEELEKKSKEKKDEILKNIKSKFKDIITDAMTIEEALEKISQALDDYKSKYTTAQSEIKSVKEIEKESARRLKEAEQRVTDIESSDNGLLTIELEKTKEKHEEEKKELNTRHNETLDKLKQEHKDELDKQDATHQVEIGKIKEENKRNIDRINSDNAEKLKQCNEECSRKISEIQQEASNKERKLNEKLSEKQKTIGELETLLKNESEKHREKTIGVITKLHAFLKNNEVMAACCDEYRDKVEEKLRDLTFNSEEMMNEVIQLPQPKTPSEWDATLKSYVTDRIEENTSLINILLKYYVLSSLPFMIDAERDNGLYFIRKNIKEAHDYVIAILGQCNITPILPSLFVENINEGLYEVEGQFNDVESFCPGSINEHIEHIERSSEGLNNIIIGVARVGYLIGSEKIIKAQVLTS